MREFGLIFDFDGTICLSEHTHMDSWVVVANSRNLPLPEGFMESGVGVADAHIARTLEELWGGRMSASEALAAKCKEFRSRDGASLPLVDGVLSFLESALERGIAMALATSSSKHDIEPVFRAYQLNRFFKEVFTIESVKNPKPDPEMYLMARSALGVDRFYVFEDSKPGVQSARAAGGKVIGVGTTHESVELGDLHGYILDYSDASEIWSMIA